MAGAVRMVRASLIRILGFFGTLLLVSVCVGMLLSQMEIPPEGRLTARFVATVITVLVSYVLGYRPGYLVHWLLGHEDRTR